MEVKFQVQTSTTIQDLTALQRASQPKWLKILLWICAVFCMISAITLWIWDAEDKINVSLITLFIWAIVLFLDRFSGWMSYRGRNRGIKEISYTFCDETLLIQDALEEGKLGYAAFTKLVEDRKRYFLFVQKHAAYILPKSDFTEGDPAEFGAFIAEKTGLKVKRV